ncbi:MAG: hypothetical protein CML13_15825 [Puniceicoccaceae bacterium]|nr:hypothetical protein [Puniceicoccaceae bacterium]|tara:strand:- start:405 stop:656 length:252 start_codon:yes stop_codon:yes gene_type:complete
MNDREFLIWKNILKQLKEADGLLVLDTHLQQDVEMATRDLTTTEFTTELAAIEARQLITSVRSERGLKYKINDAGRAWLIESR